MKRVFVVVGAAIGFGVAFFWMDTKNPVALAWAPIIGAVAASWIYELGDDEKSKPHSDGADLK